MIIDTTQLDAMAKYVAALRGNLDANIGKAMTGAAFDARDYLKQQTATYISNPTKWTLNSTFVSRATPNNPAVMLGFKDYASKGTPAARYLQPIAAGQPRSHKGFERQLQDTGVLRPGEYAVPTNVHPLRLNAYGNLTGPAYVRVLSGLKGFREGGYTANTKGASSFFVGEPGGLPRGIYARVGSRPRSGGQPRGFHTVFNITRQPKYKQSFPARRLMIDKFNEKFPTIFERLVFKSK